MLTARNCDLRRPAAPTTSSTITARSRINPSGFCATLVGCFSIARISFWAFTTSARRLVPPMSIPTITSFAGTIGTPPPCAGCWVRESIAIWRFRKWLFGAKRNLRRSHSLRSFKKQDHAKTPRRKDPERTTAFFLRAFSTLRPCVECLCSWRNHSTASCPVGHTITPLRRLRATPKPPKLTLSEPLPSLEHPFYMRLKIDPSLLMNLAEYSDNHCCSGGLRPPDFRRS